MKLNSVEQGRMDVLYIMQIKRNEWMVARKSRKSNNNTVRLHGNNI
jgi:hypothetical protein